MVFQDRAPPNRRELLPTFPAHEPIDYEIIIKTSYPLSGMLPRTVDHDWLVIDRRRQLAFAYQWDVGQTSYSQNLDYILEQVKTVLESGEATERFHPSDFELALGQSPWRESSFSRGR